jgi:hypothetical protein
MGWFWILIFLSLYGCESAAPPADHSSFSESKTSFNWQKINSRDVGDPLARYPLYIAKVPSDWIRKDPSATESIIDTTKPLCEFLIKEGADEGYITIYNFPTDHSEERIPPSAQIMRWKGQFETLDPQLTAISPEAHGGFVGLFLECQGILKGQPTKLLGWAMQLAPEHYQKLSSHQAFNIKQIRADYTIKAWGSPDLINKHRTDIITFANSFELLDELPALH